MNQKSGYLSGREIVNMANENIKDFNKMLNAPMEAKIVTLDPEGAKKWGGTTMVVAKKIDFDNLIKKIPEGKIATTNELRSSIARQYKTEICCPLTTGIFTNIVAWASYQRTTNITPYWRVLKADGALNEKFPEYPTLQKRLLENEGFSVYQKGKKYYVKDYEKHICNFN